MTSVQERLQINRTPLDKWSVREQLCLASAVACSGDQNWMSVSRTLKIVCGSTKDALQTRPADWFSQKNCAVQYGHLLEEVETPKRKKRSSESSVSSSPATVEPPTEAILRRLTEERMQEIKVELRREQEEYAKLYAEIKAIQNGQVSDDQLVQMWKEIEKEQEMHRIEEMKLENQLRERELKKQELQRSWRTGTNPHSSSSSTNSLKSSTDTTAVDMDVEEIIGSGKTIIQSSNNTPSGQAPTGTSPLLSSLLKSPTTTTPTTNIVTSSPSVRNTAPTITTLLTGGSIPNQNQPALIPSHDEAVQLLTRPISGPPLDSIPTQGSAAQNLLSPSQSAPTLSMLLEKNKNNTGIAGETKTVDLANSTNNTTPGDSNNESVPMDIEEDLTATKIEENASDAAGGEDDTDPNEEQQLLEVFKNIGNIEELDIDVSDVIDEEVDFLKGVDEETPLDENIDLEQKLDDNYTNLAEDIKLLDNENVNNENPVEEEKEKSTVDIKLESSNKVEIISSDDSNDNIPLAAVASLESSKDRLNMNESSNEDNFLKDQVESAILKNEQEREETANENNSNNKTDIKQELTEEQKSEKCKTETLESENDTKKKSLVELNETNDDVFVAPLVEDNKQEVSPLKSEKDEPKGENKPQQDENDIKVELKEENEMNVDPSSSPEAENNEQNTSNSLTTESPQDHNESLVMPKIQPPPSISIADTDENSSSTDISVQTRKDEKHSTSSSNRGHRKSPHETKTDDEMPNPSLPHMATPHSGNLTPRPTALRKLRDRDRSESPMIDDDATTHSDHSTTNHRSRRRYSSTPVIDSIPNSPASSDRDERELRASKKSLLSIYNVLYASKYSATLQRVLNDELSSSTHKLEDICLRPIDFVTIKKNIETGLIRTVYELQRDILLMCQNALMITKSSSTTFKTILQFQQECQNIREFMANGCEPSHKLEREARDTKSNSSTSSSTGGGGTSKGRSGSRKSLRLS
ncbi:bromodomain containing 8 isoform 1-T2 [Cochliomyia hominivorax]